MALRHAVLAALLHEELSGYQLAKAFDTGVANFWHALPQQLRERATFAEAKVELFGSLLRTMRGDRDEEEFLRHGDRIGPYLTCLRGLAFEEGNRDWCLRGAAVLEERRAARARG